MTFDKLLLSFLLYSNIFLNVKKGIYILVSADENSIGNVVLLSVEKVLELIESAYPNPITIQDVAR